MDNKSKNSNNNKRAAFFKKRQSARYYALQALYSWSITEDDVNVVEKNILFEKNLNKLDYDHFKKLLFNITKNTESIDAAISPHLNIPLKDLDAIELAILRISTYELLNCKDIPPKVAINEAVELSKKFGATDSHKFINGVLDKLAKSCSK